LPTSSVPRLPKLFAMIAPILSCRAHDVETLGVGREPLFR
jgi:hypothetical protein